MQNKPLTIGNYVEYVGMVMDFSCLGCYPTSQWFMMSFRDRAQAFRRALVVQGVSEVSLPNPLTPFGPVSPMKDILETELGSEASRIFSDLRSWAEFQAENHKGMIPGVLR